MPAVLAGVGDGAALEPPTVILDAGAQKSSSVLAARAFSMVMPSQVVAPRGVSHFDRTHGERRINLSIWTGSGPATNARRFARKKSTELRSPQSVLRSVPSNPPVSWCSYKRVNAGPSLK